MKICPNCRQEYSDPFTVCPNDGQLLQTAQDPMLGKVLDNKYRLEQCIGVGGMATVYLATRMQIGDEVAVKVLSSDSLKNPLAVARFRREAQAAARIRHNSVVTIHDLGNLPEGNTFLVMEYIRGHSLRDELKLQGTLTLPRAVSIMSAVCSAVQAAHDAGIIHRDLKPENIMIERFPDKSESVKVVDFGVAELREHVISDALTKLTEDGMMVGTPYYISPEQCRGEALDNRSDIYSLGIILYEILVGTVPFRGRTLSAVIVQHATEPPPSLRKYRHDIGEEIENIVFRALAKDRKQRPETARDLAHLLEQVLAGTTLNDSSEFSQTNVKFNQISGAHVRNFFGANSRTGGYPVTRKSGSLNHDSLTGLHSHAYFLHHLEETLIRAAQLNDPLSVVLFGIDRFKRINETYGYLMGDFALREVGQLLNTHLPEYARLYRAPGDGFTMVINGQPSEKAMDIVRELCRNISQVRFLSKEIPDGLELTISAGVSSFPEDSANSADLYEASQRALRQAKNRGANQIAHARHKTEEHLGTIADEPPIFFDSFVGRKTEMDKLLREFENSVASRNRFVLVIGAAGLGKTKLVEEFRRRLAGKDILFLQGRFYESGGAVPYKVFSDSLRGSIHYLMEQAPTNANEIFGSLSDRVINDFTTGDPLSALLAGDASYGGDQEKYRIFDYLSRIYLSLSRLRPVMLFLDDLQWADELTLDFLAYLLRATSGERIFIVATSREWELSNENNPVRGWLRQMSRYGNQEQIKLTPLTEKESNDVLQQMFSRLDISPEMLLRLCRETKGNPFYLIEIVRLLIEEQVIEWKGTKWVCRDVSEIHLPTSIVDLVEAHLVKLPTQALDVFTQAAVLGDEFTFDTLASVTEMDEDTLLPIIEAGLREHILKEEPHAREDRYSFYHSTMRKVLYERTSRRRRKRLHQQIGQRLEELYADKANKIAAELVYHYYNAEDYEHALRYAVEAGNVAWRAFAYSEAAKYYEWAEKSIRSLTASFREDSSVGGNQIMQLAAVGLQIEAERIAQYHLNYGRLFMQIGNHKRAEEELRQTLEFARQTRSLKLVGRSFTVLGELYRQYGHLTKGLEYGEQALAVLSSIEDSEWEVQALMVIGASHETLGHFARSIENYEGALVLARKISDKVSEGNALGGLGLIYYRLGQYEKSQDAAKRALEIHLHNGDKLGQERCYNLIGMVQLDIGQYPEAYANFERALKLVRDMGYRLLESKILNNIGENCRLQTRYQEARNFYEQALTIASETSDRAMEATILLNLGLFFQGQGHHEAAMAEFRKVEGLLRELGLRSIELETLVSIGDSLRLLNRGSEAGAYYQKALDISRQSGSPVFEWRALYGLAKCERLRGDIAASLKMLKKTVEVIDLMSSELSTYANRLSFLKNKQIVYNDLAELSQEVNRTE